MSELTEIELDDLTLDYVDSWFDYENIEMEQKNVFMRDFTEHEIKVIKDHFSDVVKVYEGLRDSKSVSEYMAYFFSLNQIASRCPSEIHKIHDSFLMRDQ